MMKPRILIAVEDSFDPNTGNGNIVLCKEYSDAVYHAGGTPLVALDIRTAKEYADVTDALLLIGGPVIHPARYGSVVRDFSYLGGFSGTRDNMDFALAKLFLAQGKPILGIGRGAMVVNVLTGGTVNESIGEKGAETEDTLSGQMEKLLGKTITFKRSYGWGIGRLGEGMQPEAVAPDGTVDAIVHKEKPVWGVVWHPEHPDDGAAPDNRLYEMFVSAAASAD